MSRDARLSLAMLGLHPTRAAELRRRHGGAVGVLDAIEGGFVEVSASVKSRLTDGETALVRLGNYVPCFRGDLSYPPLLAQRPDAPDVLFVDGALPKTPCVAVVGSRRCTAYGRRLAEDLGMGLARAGWPVASGLARGIDGATHRGVVTANGIGAAVLGCGIDRVYPVEHTRLAARLVELGGCVVSEYPPGSPPEGWRFPPRNRIIAGLSAVVVVVEAAVRGGALITAAAGLDHGTLVCAVPGDVDRETSEGCNLLIRDGALPVLGTDDLIETVELVLGPAPSSSVV